MPNRLPADSSGNSTIGALRRAPRLPAMRRRSRTCSRPCRLAAILRPRSPAITSCLAQQYRAVGKIKAAIDTELALAKKAEAAPRGKGLLFGIYLRTQISYLTLGDLQQAEIYLNKNLALLAESRRWPNVDAFRSSWEANVENGRARLEMRRGKFREAEASFRKSQGLLRDSLAKSAELAEQAAGRHHRIGD